MGEGKVDLLFEDGGDQRFVDCDGLGNAHPPKVFDESGKYGIRDRLLVEGTQVEIDGELPRNELLNRTLGGRLGRPG